MNKLISAIALCFAVVSNVHAVSAQFEVVAKNTSQETQLCMIAAEQGYQAAAKAADSEKQLTTVKCNKQSLEQFAKSFEQAPAQARKTQVAVQGNESLESELCIKAVKEGIRAVGHRSNSLKCNGVSVNDFIKTFKS